VVEEQPALERTAPVSFGLVCFRHVDGNAATDALAEAVNAAGSVLVTPSAVDGRRFIRVAVGATATTERDLDRLRSIVAAALPAAAA
jgi:hypothetical protein